MIETLISSKTRVKLLMKFFLNSNNIAYLRNLEEEFQESTNGIRLELNKFEKAGFLDSFSKGNKKLFKVNNIMCRVPFNSIAYSLQTLSIRTSIILRFLTLSCPTKTAPILSMCSHSTWAKGSTALKSRKQKFLLTQISFQ